ncbi:MAG: MBL fold metallo-hydrolase [Lachnospiraceae bacterium]|nr:MBL fold metallo-hydrolase [Lachnospiraceae bacterium]
MEYSYKMEQFVVGPIQTNCYMVINETAAEAVIIDPGEEAKRLAEEIRKQDVRPVAILLTHGHNDHIDGVNGLVEEFPDLKVYISKAEEPMVLDGRLGGFGDTGYRIHPDYYVEDGETLSLSGLSYRVISSPGHTAGSVCYYLEDQKILFAGDTLFYESYGRFDLPTGSRTELAHSLKKLLTELPGEVRVFPGHGGSTTIAHEKQVEGF